MRGIIERLLAAPDTYRAPERRVSRTLRQIACQKLRWPLRCICAYPSTAAAHLSAAMCPSRIVITWFAIVCSFVSRMMAATLRPEWLLSKYAFGRQEAQ